MKLAPLQDVVTKTRIPRSTAMKRKLTPNPASPAPNTGSEEIPPGATRAAFDRPENDEHGPGSGAGTRHAADDAGSPNEYGAVDSNAPAAEPEYEPELPDDQPPYAGISGGAVGGTPAEGRVRGGHMTHGIAPGEHPSGTKKKRKA